MQHDFLPYFAVVLGVLAIGYVAVWVAFLLNEVRR